ncbi:phenylpropionate dioxygenase-like ring-hydroxylating dioxygenase large terminal subunit [Rhodococcus opacus]|nr:phenylpropionate dioxygenase-like ring-hydroxylating dioxygenase large terminal subunit [Rhodococcus opacus]
MQFLKNAWYMAAWSQDLGVGKLLSRTIIGVPVVLYRSNDGVAHALMDRCPHRFAPLSRGGLNDRGIACGYHGLEFDHDGVCIRNPHPSGKIPKRAHVNAYPVVERDTIAWIWMGDRDPDEDLIPDYSILTKSNGVTRRDYLLMDASFDLIVDNLLDCSHTSFLHKGVLGTEGMIAAPTRIEQTGDTLNVIRTIGNVEPPAMLDMQYKQNGEPVDTWTDFRWDVPSSLLLDVGVTEPDAPRERGTGYFGVHILTPETTTTTHYHTSAARWNIRPGSETEEVRDLIADMRKFAFEEEDEPMIQAQQRVITLTGASEGDQVMLETDIGIVRWRRIMDRLLHEEDTAHA